MELLSSKFSKWDPTYFSKTEIRNTRLISTFSIGLLVTVVISLAWGAVSISPSALWALICEVLHLPTPFVYTEDQAIVFWHIRLPRVILSILVGSGLAVSGTALQGLFRNPLADPSLIGISSGASLAAVATIVFNSYLHFVNDAFTPYLLPFSAFLGALGITFLVYHLSQKEGQFSISTMLLIGLAVNAFAMALTGLIISLANDQQLRDVTFWNLGSLGGATWEQVIVLTPFILAACIFIPRMATAYNLLALGEPQATHLGVNLKTLKRKSILLATLAVGGAVAIAGTIGFVALIVPHIIRRWFGADNRLVIPLSALGGAIILTLADTLARTLIAPVELPIGVLTALIGAPLFVYILLKDKTTQS